MNAFFNFEFSYCPLIWMCYSHTNNRKINRLHEICLRIIYNDKQSSFSDLLEKDSLVSIHMRNIQSLAIKMFRVSRNISPPIKNDNFKQKHKSRYNLGQISEFSRPLAKSVYHGNESVSFLGSKIWDLLPDNYKNIDYIHTFKNKIKIWKHENCPCRLCKVYINNMGMRKT